MMDHREKTDLELFNFVCVCHEVMIVLKSTPPAHKIQLIEIRSRGTKSMTNTAASKARAPKNAVVLQCEMRQRNGAWELRTIAPNDLLGSVRARFAGPLKTPEDALKVASRIHRGATKAWTNDPWWLDEPYSWRVTVWE